MLNKLLFKHIDNSSLIVFRIIFGLLCFLEAVGAIFTGWIKRTLIEPEFTFSFIGFEFLQPLPGNWMYMYYLIMGLFGLCIMLGYKYRFSAIIFTIMWAATYFMQKASYNNHYYLLILLSGIMVFLPANRYYSIDARNNPNIKQLSMPNWCRLVFILQMLIVYTYGSLAKLYPGWLDTSFIEIIMKTKEHYFLVGELLQQKWVHYFLVYGGILFDGLIIPLLLYKPTRKWAFFASIFFHLFNSFVFQVGIFPYLSLSFALFFFEPKTIHKLFLKRKPFYSQNEVIIPSYRNTLVILGSIYFIIQIALPIRHHFIKDDVLWTEEGHRLSWRMMLRAKQGFAVYRVVNKKTQKHTTINLNDFLSRKQLHLVNTKPDVIWQFSQYLKDFYAKQGEDISVFVDCKIRINGGPYKQLIKPDIDLAAVKWDIFKHCEWILPSKEMELLEQNSPKSPQ
ncbi:HTTM domain-containing protein [Xanthomarina sp. F1114]|uniref:HTTM domain-containing protein n=1 Tax=Xanthomarina sp. F1114 TaxID=2996019 RepID=UPI00225E5CD4|nr:HTTM domain-containing protein [Xanthomarina sp. F1114]MCX7548481.1 HTTM domain-containing protein [Xanthomarina sp. F1114]